MYKPMFPEKYEGDPTNIIMRSSWETRFASWCDKNPSVVKWCSEETVVPYRCPTDNRLHRYFIDFKIKVKNRDNQLKTYLVEVKPEESLKRPVFEGIQTMQKLKNFNYAAKTYF
jgi:CRISPR/Cas system CMR-associated protein Cmr5 small subunit